MLALLFTTLGIAGPSYANASENVIPVNTDKVLAILADNENGLDEAEPIQAQDPVNQVPIHTVRSTRIFSKDDLITWSSGTNGSAVSAVHLKHFYVIQRRFSGGYQLVRLDIGRCNLDEVAALIQSQIDGYYKSGAPLYGQVRPLGFSYRLASLGIVQAFSLAVDRIGINDELSCR